MHFVALALLLAMELWSYGAMTTYTDNVHINFATLPNFPCAGGVMVGMTNTKMPTVQSGGVCLLPFSIIWRWF